jgi:putative FmdB family regulatory protein
MPTYDYECKDCGYAFEKFQSMSDETLKTCPECGKDELRRLIGGGLGIIFKGDGFYVNDNKAKNPATAPVKKDETKTCSVAESSSSSGGTSACAGCSAATGS